MAYDSDWCYFLRQYQYANYWYRKARIHNYYSLNKVLAPLRDEGVLINYNHAKLCHSHFAGLWTKWQAYSNTAILASDSDTGISESLLRTRITSGVLIVQGRCTCNMMIGGGKIGWQFLEVWKCKAPHCQDICVPNDWRKILTHDVIERRRVHCNMRCLMCNDCPVESALHLLFLCPYASSIWRIISATLNTKSWFLTCQLNRYDALHGNAQWAGGCQERRGGRWDELVFGKNWNYVIRKLDFHTFNLI